MVLLRQNLPPFSPPFFVNFKCVDVFINISLVKICDLFFRKSLTTTREKSPHPVLSNWILLGLITIFIRIIINTNKDGFCIKNPLFITIHTKDR